MDLGADFSELTALAAVFRAAPTQARPVVSREVVGSARDIRATARSMAPRATGRLAESITATGPRGGPLRAGQSMEAEIGPTVFYGHMVEGGTATQPPQPFMGPASDLHIPRLVERVAVIGAEVIR